MRVQILKEWIFEFVSCRSSLYLSVLTPEEKNHNMFHLIHLFYCFKRSYKRRKAFGNTTTKTKISTKWNSLFVLKRYSVPKTSVFVAVLEQSSTSQQLSVLLWFHDGFLAGCVCPDNDTYTCSCFCSRMQDLHWKSRVLWGIFHVLHYMLGNSRTGTGPRTDTGT